MVLRRLMGPSDGGCKTVVRLYAASIEARLGLLRNGALGEVGGYGGAEVLLHVGHGEGEHWEGRCGCVVVVESNGDASEGLA